MRTLGKTALTLCLAIGLDAAAASANWSVFQPVGGDFQLVKSGPDFFEVKGTRGDASERKSYITAVVDVKKPMPSQNKLIFSCRGLNDKSVGLNAQISFPAPPSGKVVMRSSDRITLQGSSWRDITLSLDADFKLDDAVFDIRQLKFAINISTLKPGESAGVEVKNIRLCPAADASFHDKRDSMPTIEPNPALQRKSSDNPSKLKIYFHLDNEDFDTKVCSRGKESIEDRRQYGGFRETLLDAVETRATLAKSLSEADLIVYASRNPEPEAAERIAKAVREEGKPLFVASEAVDPAIVNLLPCEISELPLDGKLPVRMGVIPAKNSMSAKIGEGLNKAAFGVYRTLKAKNGATPLLAWADGSPAVVEGQAGKGRVVYSTFTLGADLVPGKKSYDAFFIRMAAFLSGRELPEEPLPKIEPGRDGYYAGAGKENFGRFGWIIGDGLPTESISNKLMVSNGAAEYGFSSKNQPKTSLPEWSFLGVGAKSPIAIDWRRHWTDIGAVKLSSRAVVPAEWKGRPVHFHVEKGIDDTAEIKFNGKLIGKVDSSTPHYWEVPHLHAVPQELIRFGAENEIEIVSENLRGEGGFGSCPELTLVEEAPQTTLVVDRINHIGKGGVLSAEGKAERRFDSSLAFPGVRWEILKPKTDLSLYNVAKFASFQGARGVESQELAKIPSLPTDWKTPWLLLYRGGEEDYPLLLVFQRKMKTIDVLRSGEEVNGLGFSVEKGEIGMIVPIWLEGRAPADTRTWAEKLPEKVQAEIEFWYPKAFKYPMACEESFRIDRAKGRVLIRDSFSYKTTPCEWNGAKTPDYAPVPALAYATKGTLFESSEVEGWGLPTGFGEMAGRSGSNVANWSLPLPLEDMSLIPHTKGFQRADETANSIFKDAIRWSAGGRTTAASWTPRFPMGEQYPLSKNVNMHGWLMGLIFATDAPYIYDAANTALLLDRTRLRFFEPVERFQYKMATRWREEPFGGLRYPIYFVSYHRNGMKFAEGFGSKLNYGDQNETASMILTMFQRLADRYGQRDLVLANWNLISRHVSRLPLISDDWGYLASHCRESGGPATIDMLNCEYATMMKLARLSEIAGDEALREQALYRAARRMVPTIARLQMLDYVKKNRILVNPDSLGVGVGFTEDGAAFRNKAKPPCGVDLFDMSQGVPRELISLYARFAKEPVEDYLDLVMKASPDAMDYELLAAVAALGKAKDEEMLKTLDALFADPKKDKVLRGDWPGMKVGAFVDVVLFRLAGKVLVEKAEDLQITDASYDPATKIFRMDFSAGPKGALVLKSPLKALDPALKQAADGSIEIPLKPGAQKLEIAFR